MLGLGAGNYVELIAPDPEQAPPAFARPFELDSLDHPRLIGWALRCDGIDFHVAHARERGYDPGDSVRMQRTTAAGRLLVWCLTLNAISGGPIPFLIDWGDALHPSGSAPGGLTLVSFHLGHPAPASLAEALAALDADISVIQAPAPGLAGTIEGPRGPIELRWCLVDSGSVGRSPRTAHRRHTAQPVGLAHTWSSSRTTGGLAMNEASPLLRAILNLAAFHRDHEKFYATSPREKAVALQRPRANAAGARRPLVDGQPISSGTAQPLRGGRGPQRPAALQLDGVLFMEGQGEPADITRLVRDLRTVADDSIATGDWLASTMQGSCDVAVALVEIEQLAGVLGERDRIITNDWQAAHMSTLAGRLFLRAADILDHVDFAPAALRADLAPVRARGLLVPSWWRLPVVAGPPPRKWTGRGRGQPRRGGQDRSIRTSRESACARPGRWAPATPRR